MQQSTAIEIENKLRAFVSEILMPFNERISALNKDVKSCKQQSIDTINALTVVKEKLDAETKLRTQVSQIHQNV